MTPPAARCDRILLAGVAVAGVLLALRLADVLLLVFGAVLVAVLLQAIARPLRRRAGLGPHASLAAAVLVTAAAVALAGWAFGRQLEAQLAGLTELLPRAWADVRARLAGSALGALALKEMSAMPQPDGGWLGLAQRLAANAATALAATVIVLFAGLYLAFHPRTYAEGLVRLFPRPLRQRTRDTLAAIQAALERWLLGQLASMVLVGTTTGVGLWLVGAPSPVGLGVLAGVGQFVPVVGPMAATVPGLLLALAAGPQTFLLTGAVYLGAAQLEANLITPLVLRRMAELPMAVTLFAVLAMGVLLGPLGVLFATPLALVAYVLVKTLWVEGIVEGGFDGAGDRDGDRDRALSGTGTAPPAPGR